jgi:hypothetical protein
MITRQSEQMLGIWKELVSFDGNGASITSQSWQAQKALATAISSLAYDPSGVSTAMLAQDFHKSHLGGKHFSLADMISPSDNILWLMEKAQSMTNLLAEKEVVDAFAGVQQSIISALSHYEVTPDHRYNTLINDLPSLAELRLSALKMSKELQLNQFTRGDSDRSGVRPAFMKTIYKWFNVNSLLAAAVSIPNGVSMHMIGTPDAFNTYFVFLIRNGGNIYLLSDVPKEKHPLYSEKTRRPDRRFAERAEKGWFPYELADVAFDVEYEEYYKTQSKAHDLVTYQVEWRDLSAVNQLEPDTVIWLSMMFSLIIQRFWSEDIQADELSYTGEMLPKPQALIERATLANLPIVSGTACEFAPLDVASIRIENSSEDEIGKTYDLTHSWLEDRYGHKVSQAALNLTSPEDSKILLGKDAAGQIVPVIIDPESDDKSVMTIKATPFPVTRFGTARQIENDRKFLARVTYADAIQKLAQEEFEARKKEIRQWFSAAVRKNIDTLLQYAGSSSIWINDGHNTGREGTVKTNFAVCRHNADGLYHRFMAVQEISSGSNLYQLEDLTETKGGKLACNVTGAKPSYFASFTPTNARELAVLVGCEVSELPDVLQHWDLRRVSTGNSIIDRIDPVAWRTSDPWIEMKFGAVLALSKRGLAQMQKVAKLPPLNIATEEQMQHSSSSISIFGN